MDVNLRDGLLLAASTLPLSIAVAKVGLESDIHPLAIVLSSAFIFSAAAQLMIYKGLAGALPSSIALLSAFGIAIRIALYAREIYPLFAEKTLLTRAFYLLPLTDISYLEYLRCRGSSEAALKRYLVISRCLWMSWQIGTITSVSLVLPDMPFPKEGVSLLIFLCLAYAMLTSRRRSVQF